MIQSIQPIQLNNCNIQEILDYFENAWLLEDLLLKSIMRDDTFYDNPDDLRNPLIFYLGHSAAFYINKLIDVKLIENGINADYELLFGVGVDPASPAELKEAIAHIKWPDVAKVWNYRQQIHELVANFINKVNLELPIHPKHPLWALMMAIEHQRIHFETSSMLIRQLPLSSLQRPNGWQYAPHNSQVQAQQMVEVSGGVVELGKPEDSLVYGWDNEYGHRQIQVDPFLASKYLVTNHEFKIFVENHGYENQAYWDEEGWQWKQQYGLKHPKFWLVDEAGNYQYRAMFDILELPLDWPVEVNHYEASAYCRAQGSKTRLMSEAEWNLITFGNNKTKNYHPHQDEMNHYNLNLRFCSPSSVGILEPTAQICDLRGNVWQWLNDDFNPFQGFAAHPLYMDNSTPFFNSDHKMMLGGSWATNGTESLGYYRNWFRRNFYQHAGFRIVQDL